MNQQKNHRLNLHNNSIIKYFATMNKFKIKIRKILMQILKMEINDINH